ncbi:MAG: cytochrome c biogenesis protein CcsA [Acidobacteriota bacterium]
MKNTEKLLYLLAFIFMIINLYLIFLYAPPEKVMGDIQRIFYFHLSCAFIAFLSFLIVFISSILYLWKRNYLWDTLAYCSTEIGVIFTSLMLLTGSIWARPIWGAWWTWDPRLTTALVLWFLYMAYLLLRSQLKPGHDRARFCAVYGIIAFIDVPFVFMSIHWWRSIHPVIFKGVDAQIDPSMIKTLIFSLLTFLIFYWILLTLRFKIENLRNQIEILKQNTKIWRNTL